MKDKLSYAMPHINRAHNISSNYFKSINSIESSIVAVKDDFTFDILKYENFLPCNLKEFYQKLFQFSFDRNNLYSMFIYTCIESIDDIEYFVMTNKMIFSTKIIGTSKNSNIILSEDEDDVNLVMELESDPSESLNENAYFNRMVNKN